MPKNAFLYISHRFSFLLIGLAIHVAFDITLLAIAETTIARLNVVNNSLDSTS